MCNLLPLVEQFAPDSPSAILPILSDGASEMVVRDGDFKQLITKWAVRERNTGEDTKAYYALYPDCARGRLKRDRLLHTMQSD